MDGNKRESWCRHNADPDLCVICAETRPLEAQLADAQEIIVCLETDMPMAERLLNQRGTINKLEAKLAEYHKQIPHLLRFVPPQNHDPLCRLHNDAVDYLLDSIKGEDS